MEISFNLNAKIWKPVPLISTARIPKKNLKINIISCGIQELSMQREKNTNLYQVLSLESPTVGFDEIKKAYRSLALQYHPDLSPSSKKEESTRKFVELQKAYETLSDPISRNRYDRQLSLGPSSIDFGIGNAHRKEARSDISKEVWENQLNGLQRRSADRMMMKKKRYM